MLVDHHIHYKEIDGYDELIKMDVGEHQRFHRLNPDFLTPEDTNKSQGRTYKKEHIISKYFDSIPLGERSYVIIHIKYNMNTGRIMVNPYHRNIKRRD